jgi:hypothetical protein
VLSIRSQLLREAQADACEMRCVSNRRARARVVTCPGGLGWVGAYTPVASSTYLQNAFASWICRGVRHSG